LKAPILELSIKGLKVSHYRLTYDHKSSIQIKDFLLSDHARYPMIHIEVKKKVRPNSNPKLNPNSNPNSNPNRYNEKDNDKNEKDDKNDINEKNDKIGNMFFPPRNRVVASRKEKNSRASVRYTPGFLTGQFQLGLGLES
jgi:hypothetical protein